MNETAKAFHIHLVSDSTGETLDHVARACLIQFDALDAEQHIWSLIRGERQMNLVCEGIKDKPGMVLYTLINESLRHKLVDSCREMKVPCISVLDPVMNALTHFLGRTPRQQPGRQHALDQDYYSRIEAMEFALACDDGQGVDKLYKADVLLLGVSRTSKTPTCLYLANRGLFAANIPLVSGVELPPLVHDLTRTLIVGLTREPNSLVDIRKTRLRLMQEDRDTHYVDNESVAEEVLWARKLCLKHNWPILDVTRRSIEETAAEIFSLYNRRQEQG